MFEQLFAFLAATWHSLSPIFIVPVYEHAGLLRWGKYQRTCKPGRHWKVPLIDTVEPQMVVVRTMRLPPQTCTTANDESVVVSAIVQYFIENVELYICNVCDQHEVLTDKAMRAILRAVRQTDFDKLVSDPPESKIAADVRRQVKDYGIAVDSVSFVDMGRVRSIRLISASPHHAVLPEQL